MTLSDREDGFERLLARYRAAAVLQRRFEDGVIAGQRGVAHGGRANPADELLAALNVTRQRTDELLAEMTSYCDRYAY